MVYSAVKERDQSRPKRPDRTPAPVTTRAIVSLDDRRYVLDGPRATIGRSKDADCVLRDPNVSRRHAELRQAESGDWQIVDLGSTNGVKVNGRRVSSSRLRPGRTSTATCFEASTLSSIWRTCAPRATACTIATWPSAATSTWRTSSISSPWRRASGGS